MKQATRKYEAAISMVNPHEYYVVFWAYDVSPPSDNNKHVHLANNTLYDITNLKCKPKAINSFPETDFHFSCHCHRNIIQPNRREPVTLTFKDIVASTQCGRDTCEDTYINNKFASRHGHSKKLFSLLIFRLPDEARQ